MTLAKLIKNSVGGGVILISLAAINPVQAALINYSFSGTGSGSLNNIPFNDAMFNVSIDADTDDVAFQPSLGALGILNLSGSIDIEGVGIATFSNPLFVFNAQPFAFMGFGDFNNGNLITISNASLSSYDLASNFGPITGINSTLNQFVNASTSLGLLTYSTMSPVTFVSVIPEPLTILGAGTAVGFGAFFKRKLAQAKKSNKDVGKAEQAV